MSSAVNHRKRSHRSEPKKDAAYRASARRMLYRTARENNNRSVFGRIAELFRRRRQMTTANRVRTSAKGDAQV